MLRFCLISRHLRTGLRLLVSAAFSLASAARAATPANVVISQIYTAGGNSGAPYNADFIELFNPTSGNLTLNNYSVQYASAAGATISTVTLLPAVVTLAPGHHYLIAATPGSNGMALPTTPDLTNSSIAFGAASGKIILVDNATALSTACPTTGPDIVDYIAYGTGTSCATGSAAPAPSSALADIRVNACNATGNSSTEFATGTPNPRNLASPAASCFGGSSLSAAGSASPSTVNVGSSTLLSVQVTPVTGGATPSTGIAISADLTSLGGSATTAFYDDGSNGDVTASDNIFSYTATAPSSGTSGALTLPVSVRDAQLRTATTSIGLTLVVPAPVVTIPAIQAAKPSPYTGQTITTSGVVIGVKSGGFWIESKIVDPNSTVAQGAYVYAGSTTLPSYISLGNEVQVTGTVQMYSYNPSLTQAVEITSPSFTELSSNNPLPDPITLTATSDSPSGGINQFTRYEGMRVAIRSLTTTSPTDASLNEVTETNTSNGFFYGVVTGVPRPFREPGISLLEPTLPTGTPSTVTRWDGNPEVLEIDSRSTGGAAIDVTSNMVLSGIVGVMDFTEGTPSVVLDRAMRPTISGTLLTAQPVSAAGAKEFTVASFNMERFYNDKADSAGTSASSAVVVTTAAYQRRLSKASIAIRTILNYPDIIGAEEIENLAVLNDLSAKISADAVAARQTDPLYVPCLVQGNDIGGINVAFLVKSTRVTSVRCEQFGKDTTFANAGGTQAVLNDRPPLVLHADIRRTGMADYPVTVIANHLRSLISIDDTTSTGITVRIKREAQAEYLAKLIQGYQAAGEHVISVGDYNAFEFSDGYVDVLGVIRGNPVPATQVAQSPVAGLVSPALIDLVTLLSAAQRQSYVENGSAQVLDHVLVTDDLVNTGLRLEYAHMDADFPLIYLNDATRPERVSDHDPAVAYFTVPSAAASLSATSLAFGSQILSTTSPSKSVTLTNTGNDVLTISPATLAGAGFAFSTSCGPTLAPGASCTGGFTFTPTMGGAATGSLTFSTTASNIPIVIALTGSGADFSISPNVGSLTVISGSGGTYQFALSSIGGFAGSVALTCSGLTLGETCTIAPSVSLGASGSVMVPVSVQTTGRTNPLSKTSQRASSEGSGGGRSGLAFGAVSLTALFGSLGLRRSRITWRVLGISCAAIGLSAISGCSGISRTPVTNGTPAGPQTITVTAISGGITHASNVTFNVQ